MISEDEKKLYDVLFPIDNNPSHVNYGYFTGGSLRSFSILKARINKSYIDPVIIEDDKNDGSFFIRILQKDFDIFLGIVKTLKYKERRIPRACIESLQSLFGDE